MPRALNIPRETLPRRALGRTVAFGDLTNEERVFYGWRTTAAHRALTLYTLFLGVIGSTLSIEVIMPRDSEMISGRLRQLSSFNELCIYSKIGVDLNDYEDAEVPRFFSP